MIYRFLKKAYVWIGLVLVLVGLLVFYQTYYQQEIRKKVETLRSHLWHELAVAAHEQRTIQEAYPTAQIPGPYIFDLSHTYPFVIFKDGNLIYWSDSRLVPDYNLLRGEHNTQLINLKTGRYLSRRQEFEDKTDAVEIFSLIPLQYRYRVENDYLQSRLNPSIFPYAEWEILPEPTRSENTANIYSPDAFFLFAVHFQKPTTVIGRAYFFPVFALIVVLAIAGAVFLGKYYASFAWTPHKRYRYEWGFLGLLVYVCVVRFLMLQFSIPNVIIETDLFHPKYYAASVITPSLGDLLLNCLAMLALNIYVMRYFFHSQTCRLVLNSPVRRKCILTVVLLVGSFVLLSMPFYFFRTLSFSSQIGLDITESIHFSPLRLVCLGIFILEAILFFVFNYLIVRLVFQFRFSYYLSFLWVLLAGALYAMLAYAFYEVHPEIIIAGTGYLLLSIYLKLPHGVTSIKYKISLYLFLTAGICAAIGAWAIYEMEWEKKQTNKRDFARQLLSEKDPLAEVLLDEASGNIRSDPFIQSRFVGPFISKPDIIRKVKRYLGSHFNRYDVDIHVFDPSGSNLKGDDYPQSYSDYAITFGKPEYQTEYDNIHFMPSIGSSFIKRYVSLIKILKGGTIIGFVVLDVQQKRIIPTNVYPELLLDKHFVVSPESRQYSYAIYNNQELIYREGDFNYEKDFQKKNFANLDLLQTSLVIGDYQHVGMQNTEGRSVIVSSPTYKLQNWFSNFSFLFLILILVVGIYISIFTLFFQPASRRTGFATRIQIYLNLAFFLPLIAVSVVTVSLLGATYRENLTQSYFDIAQNIATELRFRFDKDLHNRDNLEYAQEELNEMARHTKSDINIFSNSGKLLLTSQSQIYEDGLLSPYINREAWHLIVTENDLNSQLAESVGTLQYNSVYVGIRDSGGKGLLGIISIPFFDSKTELDKQIIEILSTILNIFTVIFTGFLLLSYLASKILTVPLQMITQKLGKTSLQGENEPLYWQSNDEIGLLVGQYNQMLHNLEKSKQALAQSEKESAWREMAQQVAHEIKNPLTPMKLTLQHLQRTLQYPDEQTLDRAGKSIATLLIQVEILSDIATSFSAFAKMPIPKEEQFDVAGVLRKTTELYTSDPTICFETSIPEKEFWVKGDAQLIGRIFTNLIINSIQAVPEDRQPHVQVTLARQNGHVTVSVQDNGRGISDSIRAKVFVPHFSTKSSGSGIGLAVAKRGIEHAGGTIWFETEEGKGTTFFIQIPLL